VNRLLRISFLLMISLPALFTVSLWWRSCSQTDDVYYYSPSRMTRFRTSGGGFWFETRPWDAASSAKLDWQIYPDRAAYPFVAASDDPWYQRLGVLVNTTDYDLLLVAPYWLLLLFNLPIPLWWIQRSWKRFAAGSPQHVEH
jgi:hypothetical protein